MERVIDTVRNTILKYNMFEKGDGVVVGVSGGPDSVCLLHVLHRLAHEFSLRLYAAHVNHCLRGDEAYRDADYVREFCSTLSIPLFIKEVDIRLISKQKSISEEVAGRKERYKFFFEVAQRVNASKIAVAHNRDDQAETLLMRLLRGTGLEGLAGIPPVREDGVVRPLLETEREQVEQYCSDNHLNPRIDHTNQQSIYTRNKIRLELIPYLKREYNPSFIKTAAQTADLLREDISFMNSYVENIMKGQVKVKGGEVSIPVDFLLSQHTAIQRRVLRKAVFLLKGDIVNIEYKHIESILQMIREKGTGKMLDLPAGLRICQAYGYIYLFSKNNMESTPFNYPLIINGETYIRELGMKVVTWVVEKEELKKIKLDRFTKAFDYNVINKEIYIRNRVAGDRFSPYGMKGTKKLKDFFIDMKIPITERDKIPLVTAGEEIIWVVGYRTGNGYRITDATTRVLIIKFVGGDKIDK
ncbi:MAG: tRNA lysidine(34) synthetase TilS [Clostridiaceae bacterium]|nr:tRNA lysidine(34) synthetase TilS [Clostridiaceae bacterium]